MRIHYILFLVLFHVSSYSSQEECKQESPKRSPRVAAIIIPSAILSNMVKSPEIESTTSFGLSQKVPSASPIMFTPSAPYDPYVIERYNASARSSRRNSSADATLSPSVTLAMVNAEIREFQATPNIEVSQNAILNFTIVHNRARTLSQDLGERIKQLEQEVAQDQHEQSQEEAACGWCCFSKSKK